MLEHFPLLELGGCSADRKVDANADPRVHRLNLAEIANNQGPRDVIERRVRLVGDRANEHTQDGRRMLPHAHADDVPPIDVGFHLESIRLSGEEPFSVVVKPT